MKSRPFEYVRPNTLDEACQILAEHGDDAKVLAGGQSLVAAMNMRFAAPEILVDISRVEELKGISFEGDVVRIGAMARHADVLKSDLVAANAPLIHQAMPHIAHPTIRNRGTFGGSLVNADPASELPACTIALNAIMNIRGSSGERRIYAVDFFEGTYATCLEPDEILVSVDVPVAKPDVHFFFEEFSRRQGDYAMAGLAAQVTLSGGTFADARFAFFGVSDKAILDETLAAHIEGKSPEALDAAALGDAVGGDIEVIEDLTTSVEAKRHLMKVLASHAISAWGES